MAEYKLNYTAEEVDALLAKVNGGVVLPMVELETEFDFDNPPGGMLETGDAEKLLALKAAGVPAFIGRFADVEERYYTMVFGMTSGWLYTYGWYDFFRGECIGLLLNTNGGGYMFETY